MRLSVRPRKSLDHQSTRPFIHSLKPHAGAYLSCVADKEWVGFASVVSVCDSCRLGYCGHAREMGS